jgi:putative membrane protein
MIKTNRLALMFGMALFSLAACQRAEQAATTVQSAAQAQMTPTLSTTDATFINMAGTSGIEEVTFGQLAQTKASRAAVRRFAAQMVADHTTANQQLVALARAKQITPPSSMDTTHDQLYQQLQSMRGRDFDRAYMDSQVQDHEMAVQAFETEATNGTDPQVRSFAQQHLPKMRQHLQMARTLAGHQSEHGATGRISEDAGTAHALR